MKYRSRSDIAAKILTLALDGSMKTRLMYNAYLSYPQLVEYLEVLEGNGLLIHTGNLFHTTKKGRSFLQAYKTMNDMLVLEVSA